VSSQSSGASPSSAVVGRRGQRCAFSEEPNERVLGGGDDSRHPHQPIGLIGGQRAERAPVGERLARENNPVDLAEREPAGLDQGVHR